jgi:hypothetical protein
MYPTAVIQHRMKSKKLPPFCPVYKLMIDLDLPANILDGLQIFCPWDSLDE